RARRDRRRLTGGDIARGILRTVGELLFTAGLVMLFFAVYEVYGKQIETDREQQQLSQGLEETWEAGPDSEPLPGSADSRKDIPRRGLQWVPVKGGQTHDLRYRP